MRESGGRKHDTTHGPTSSIITPYYSVVFQPQQTPFVLNVHAGLSRDAQKRRIGSLHVEGRAMHCSVSYIYWSERCTSMSTSIRQPHANSNHLQSDPDLANRWPRTKGNYQLLQDSRDWRSHRPLAHTEGFSSGLQVNARNVMLGKPASLSVHAGTHFSSIKSAHECGTVAESLDLLNTAQF